MHKHCPAITAISGFAVLAVGMLCSWYGFPKIIEHEVKKQIDLKPGTKAFEVWRKQPFPLIFKVYIFNVSNPGDVMVGEKPILKELGPYIYSVDVERVEAEINQKDDTIKYYLKKTFRFDKVLSGCRTEEDAVTILNAALMGIVLQVEALLPSAISMIRDAYPYMFPNIKDMFLKTTVGELLFKGIILHCTAPEIDFLCGTMKGFLPEMITVAENDKDFVFSMFGFMNATPVGPYVMQRGMKPNSTRGELISFMNEDALSIWNGDGCNMINGSDSGMYFTMKRPSERIYLFTADICRSMFVSYDEPKVFEGIKAFKYSTKRESLAKTPENVCFCPLNDEGGYDCPSDGLVDLSPCLKAPVLLSFPHFLYADESLIEYAIGTKPNKDLHESFLIIEPLTATPLSGSKRVQMSLTLKPIKDVPLLANVTKGVFPVLWLDEYVAIPEDFIAFMKSNFNRMSLLTIVKWGIILIGIGLMIVSCVLMMYQEKLLCFGNKGKVSVSPSPLQVQVNANSFKRPALYPQNQTRVEKNLKNSNNGEQNEVWQFKL